MHINFFIAQNIVLRNHLKEENFLNLMEIFFFLQLIFMFLK